jgi:hypothetical protein
MPKRGPLIEAEITRRLAAAITPDSPNRITGAQLREWAVEYLREIDEDMARFPDYAGEPHWNLWMMDARYEDALFVVLIFRPEALEFFCGTGNAFDVRSYSDHFAGNEAEGLFEAMQERFHVPEGLLRLDRKAAAIWLGRGW